MFKQIILSTFLMAQLVSANPRLDAMGEIQLAMDNMDDFLIASRSKNARLMYEETKRSEHSSGSYHAPQDNTYEDVLASLEASVSKAKEGYETLLNEISDPSVSLKDFLALLLKGRLNELLDRTERLEPFFGRRDVTKFVVPTIDYFYKKMAVRDIMSKIQLAHGKQELEILERLILLTFRSIEPEEITGDALKYLNMSPSLWPLLANENVNFNSFDMCGGYAPLVFLYSHLDKSKWKATQMNNSIADYVWPAYQDIDKLHAYFPDDIRQAYQAFRQGCDSEIYRAHTKKTKIFVPEDGTLGSPNKKMFKLLVHEADYWPKIDMPPFLRELLEKRQAHMAFNLGPSFFDAPDVEKYPMATVSENPRVIITKSQSGPEDPENEILDASGPPEADETSEGAGVAEAMEVFSEQTKKKAPEEDFESAAPEAHRAAHLDSFVYRDGLRRYKGALLQQVYPPRGAGEIKEFLACLFDGQQNLKLTFRDVAITWKRIGGSIEGDKNGGSHRVFIAPDGVKLWGTYDHGGFGKNTIKYVQAAFHFLGYRPPA